MPKREERIIQILINRDGCTREEAEAQVENAKSELFDAMYGTSLNDPEDVLMTELGLEPDYLFDLI